MSDGAYKVSAPRLRPSRSPTYFPRMRVMADGIVSSVLKKSGKDLQAAWTRDLAAALPTGKGRISAIELDQQTGEFPPPPTPAAEHAKGSDVSAAEFKPIREFLEGVSRSRAVQGF